MQQAPIEASESAQASGASDAPGPPIRTKPWVLPESEECCARYCQYCRPTYADRSYLSLDGIANGEIPATAASGFGFHCLGARPVMNLEHWKNIGLRPVPLPRGHPAAPRPPEHADSNWQGDEYWLDSVVSPTIDQGDGSSDQLRLPYTPPPTPTGWTGISKGKNGMTLFANTSSFVYDGRSDESLMTNIFVYDQVMRSISGLVNQDHLEGSPLFGMFMPIDQPTNPGADSTTMEYPHLHGLNCEGEGAITPMVLDGLEESSPHQDPSNIGHGVAVFEESVETGSADIVTQT